MNVRFTKSFLYVACPILMVGLAVAKPGKGNGGGNGGGKGGDKGKGGKSERTTEKPEKKEQKNDESENKHHDKGDSHGQKDKVWKGKRLEEKERSVFFDYFKQFKGSPLGLPPGLAKNFRNGKPLPPGWQKKVSEGYIIDDENSGFFQLLDEALFPNYQRVPDTRLYMYGDRLVRVYEPRRQVIDIFQIPGIRLF